MALNKVTLATAIKNALDATLEEAKNKDINGEIVRQNYANRIADAFDTYVKTIQITIGPGTIVVSGSAVTQSNLTPIIVSNSPPSSIT